MSAGWRCGARSPQACSCVGTRRWTPPSASSGATTVGPGSALDLPIYGHHLLPAHLHEYEQPRLAAWRDGTGREPFRDWEQVHITPPTDLVTQPTPLDLGGRIVQLLPLAPGHTDNDLVVHVPDAGTWVVGDVLEQPGPPVYGSGCFPWPGRTPWPGCSPTSGHTTSSCPATASGRDARRSHR